MRYGITVSTAYRVRRGDPNKSGDYGLVYPAPGELYTSRKEADEAFEEVVRSHQARRLGFLATLNSYTARSEETLRRENYDGDPVMHALYE